MVSKSSFNGQPVSRAACHHVHRSNHLAGSSITIVILLLLLVTAVPGSLIGQIKKIAVFGSSVAKGSGDTSGTGGYAGMIKNMMELRGWTVVNVSRGGDNTVKIMPRFQTELLPEKPGYVIIGLSLGNEGIANQPALKRDRIFEQFRSGMVRLIRLVRENGMIPVVVNCYARNDFGQEEYDAIQQMNMEINTWDVPSINALGAIDNGQGNWADGFWHDKSHPNLKGHREIFHTFVPGLFDALAMGKKCPDKIRSDKYVAIPAKASSSPLVYIPDDTIHSFSISFLVNSREDGTIASLLGKKSHVLIILKSGRIICQWPGKEILLADTTNENNGWQYVVLTHRYATGTTAFYVNGKSAGSIAGAMDFKEFILGGSGNKSEAPPSLAGYKDLLIYRSALNAGEVKAIYCGRLLQSSLEIYAPLDDPGFRNGTAVANHAQSMSKLLVKSDFLISLSDNKGQTTK